MTEERTVREIGISVIVIVAICLLNQAHAQIAADQDQYRAELVHRCAESFPERLVDAKRALRRYEAERAEYKKSGIAQKAEWMAEHCRPLSDLEIAIRKTDDPMAFVCDPHAKGRPSALLFEAPEPPSLLALQGFHVENEVCRGVDTTERVALGMTGDETDRVDVMIRLEVICYDDARPACIAARAQIAAVRAKQEEGKSDDQTGREDHRATANPNAAARAAQNVR
jgi:hypothetical protein